MDENCENISVMITVHVGPDLSRDEWKLGQAKKLEYSLQRKKKKAYPKQSQIDRHQGCMPQKVGIFCLKVGNPWSGREMD